MGDSGLLASLMYRPANDEKKRDIGIIAHWTLKGKIEEYIETAEEMFSDKTIEVLNMGNPELDCNDLFEFICSSKVIVSCSLHGIIFAHSFGVPALYFSDARAAYKFMDYYSVYDGIDYGDLARKTTLEDALNHIEDEKFIESVNPSHEDVQKIQRSIVNALPYKQCFTGMAK